MRSQSNTTKYKVVSLFSGCGGLDLGFRGGFTYLDTTFKPLDFEVIWANDNDEKACRTFAENFECEHIICADIKEILAGNKHPKSADVVLGGFPCQDFSHAGKRRGFDSERGNLYKSMVEVIKRTRPIVFVAENVKGLLTYDKGRALKTIEQDFEKLGYTISTKLYHAAEYGVPQSRERVIIVGTDKERALPAFDHPNAIYAEDEWISLEQAIGDLVDVAEGERPNHYWSKAKMFPGTQGNTTVSKDKIGPTMRAEHHGNIEWHWNKKRRLSAREAARIQTFPDDFVFLPSTSSAYRQIGNAVPPVLGWHIAHALQQYLIKHVNAL